MYRMHLHVRKSEPVLEIPIMVTSNFIDPFFLFFSPLLKITNQRFIEAVLQYSQNFPVSFYNSSLLLGVFHDLCTPTQ